jgi:hypothetical protein
LVIIDGRSASETVAQPDPFGFKLLGTAMVSAKKGRPTGPLFPVRAAASQLKSEIF